MKYCPNCGNQLKDNARFCGKCGNAVRELKHLETPVIEETEKPVIKPVKQRKQKKKNRHMPFILALAVLAAGITGALAAGVIRRKGSVGEIYYKGLDPEHVKGEGSIAYVDNEILLTASEGTGKKDIENLIKPYSGKIVGYIEVTGDYQIEFEEIRMIEDLDELAEVLKNDPAVKRASVNYVNEVSSSAVIKEVKASPDELDVDGTWGWEAIHAPEAWEYLKDPNTKAVNVGVLEHDRFYLNHPEISDICEYFSFTGNAAEYHGTAVASVLAADSTDGSGMSGIYPLGREANGKKHMCFGTLATTSVTNARSDMAGLMSYKAEIADLAMHDCKVINASFGSTTLYSYFYPDTEFAAKETEKWKREAAEMGAFLRDLFTVKDFLIIKASGNESHRYYITLRETKDKDGNIVSFDYDPSSKKIYLTNQNGSVHYSHQGSYNINGGDSSKVLYLDGQLPMEYCSLFGVLRLFGGEYQEVLDRVIVTGAVGKDFNNDSYYVSDFSNEGELYMPGEKVLGAVYDNTGKIGAGYDLLDGTSLAAPMLSGVAAMVWSQNEYLTAPSVKRILQNSLIQYDNITMVDAEAAVKRSTMYAQVPDDSRSGKGILAGVFAVYEKDYTVDGYLNIKDLKSGELTKYRVKGDKDFYLMLEEGDYQLISAGVNNNSYGKVEFEDKVFHISEDEIVYEKIPLYQKLLNGQIKYSVNSYSYAGDYKKAKHTDENLQYYVNYEDTIDNGRLTERYIDAHIDGIGGWGFPNTIKYTYNEQGLVLREETTLQDGLLISITDYKYDDYGNVLHRLTKDRDPFYDDNVYGAPEWSEYEDIYEYSYNSDGTIAGYKLYGRYDITTKYKGATKLNESVVFSYDSLKRMRTKSSNMESISYKTTMNYSYDDAGRMVASWETDSAGKSLWKEFYTYDSFDRMTESVHQYSGDISSVSVDVYSYAVSNYGGSGTNNQSDYLYEKDVREVDGQKFTTIIITDYQGTSENVVIPDRIEGFPVVQIAKNVFSGKPVTSVKLPKALEMVGREAFADCNSLQSVIFQTGPRDLTIKQFAFKNCTNLKEVTLPNQLMTIEKGAFESCTGLERISIPFGTKQIGEGAFNKCSSLSEIIIPNTIEKIGTDALKDTALKDIYYYYTENKWNNLCKEAGSLGYSKRTNIHYLYDINNMSYEAKGDGKSVFRGLIINGIKDNPEGGSNNDCDLMSDRMKNNRLDNVTVDPSNIHTFAFDCDNSPISEEIFNQQIDNCFKDTDGDDISFLYYSGHSGRSGEDWTYTTDIGLALGEYEYYSWEDLIKYLNNNVKGKIILVIDACYSDNIIVNGITKLDMQDRQRFTVLASCGTNEESETYIRNRFERNKKFYGLFTLEIGEAIGFFDGRLHADKNKNNIVTMDEVYEYVKEKVKEKSIDNSMHVSLYTVDGSLTFFQK